MTFPSVDDPSGRFSGGNVSFCAGTANPFLVKPAAGGFLIFTIKAR